MEVRRRTSSAGTQLFWGNQGFSINSAFIRPLGQHWVTGTWTTSIAWTHTRRWTSAEDVKPCWLMSVQVSTIYSHGDGKRAAVILQRLPSLTYSRIPIPKYAACGHRSHAPCACLDVFTSKPHNEWKYVERKLQQLRMQSAQFDTQHFTKLKALFSLIHNGKQWYFGAFQPTSDFFKNKICITNK